MRRLFGVARNLDGVIQSALPSIFVDNIGGEAGYSIFADGLYQASGDTIYRNTLPANPDHLQNGDRLTFLKMRPYLDYLEDYLFVAGGGKLMKFAPDGTPSNWGIAAPEDGFTVGSAGNNVSKLIDATDAVGATEWHELHGVAPTLETDIVPIGGGSAFAIKQTISGPPAAGDPAMLAIVHDDIGTLDLDQDTTPGVKSSEEDFIQVYFRASDMTAITGIEIQFSIGDTTFEVGTLTRRIPMDNTAGASLQEPKGVVRVVQTLMGTHNLVDSNGRIIAYDVDPSRSFNDIVTDRRFVRREDIGSAADDEAIVNLTGTPAIPNKYDTWFRIRVPKASFVKGGEIASDWNDIRAIKLTVLFERDLIAVDTAVYWARPSLVGGSGIIGDYQYQVTYLDSVTGHRSNPNPTKVMIKGVDREFVSVGNLPVLTEAEALARSITHIEIWRTVGHGEIMFKAGEVEYDAALFTDTVADYPGLFTGDHLVEADFPEFLQELELLLDNDPPPDTYDFVVSEPFAGRAWWVADSDHPDRAWYSPAGRPQAFQGDVICGTTDDPTMAGVVWNDVLYVFTQQHVFRISGDDEENFNSTQIFGAPGTYKPHTVVATPYGIFYQAIDGIRLFDGSGSRLIGYEQIAPLFLDQSSETIAPFAGETACWGEDEYFISNGSCILIYRPMADRWRLLQVEADTLYSHRDEQKPVASIGGNTYKMEDLGGTFTLPMQVQTPTYRSTVDSEAVVKFVFLDLDTQGQNVFVQLVFYNDEAHFLGTVNTSGRQQVEMVAGFPTKVVGVRLISIAPLLQITIWGIELDIYEPCMEGAA